MLKWCHRCHCLPVESADQKRVAWFQESVVVFCQHLRNIDDQLHRAELLGRLFQVDAKMSNFYLTGRRADVSLSGDTLTIGARDYSLSGSGDGGSSVDSNFCLTRLSCNLLEFVSNSVAQAQPVLLVGETGVGKTTAVQYLSKVGKKDQTKEN